MFAVAAVAIAAGFASPDARLAVFGDSAARAAGTQRSNGDKEYQLKAAFLLNFARYTSWPKGTFANPDSPIVFGIVGEDPFGAAIDKMLKDKKIGQRPLVVWRFSQVKDISGVHLLFVGRQSRKEGERLQKRFARQPVLTVGDQKGMAGKGVVAAFYLEKKRLRFEMSVKAIRDSKLAISSQLLKLAHIPDREKKAPARKQEADEKEDK